MQEQGSPGSPRQWKEEQDQAAAEEARQEAASLLPEAEARTEALRNRLEQARAERDRAADLHRDTQSTKAIAVEQERDADEARRAAVAAVHSLQADVRTASGREQHLREASRG